MSLLELAQRVEALDGPCLDMDHEIALALNAPDWRKEKPWERTNGWAEPNNARDAWAVLFYDAGGNPKPVAHYSASIDAAMTLVPEGHDMQIHLFAGRGGEASCIVTQLKRIGLPRIFAASPALAITAAALRARAAMEGETNAQTI